ncbi:MAG TPA: hypothetical protein VGQ99_20955 [Tepidisphaeraceae bacterium]|jgi:hypothetical protein|nr:hypothetical protein [Tepidisphaeraceae bacterium]HEV8607817.1 hypothetical protein [Tepidisphaeraceae bacterium]
METHKIIVKFFAETAPAIRGEQFVPIFHSWIQQQAIPDHLLIDVADYQHVTGGPGTVLVAHEANFSTDREDGKLGLMYARKQPATGDFFQRLHQAFRACLHGCARLESDTQLRFKTSEAIVRLNDRLLAPNNPETYSSIEPHLRKLVNQLYPNADTLLEHHPHPLRLFEVHIKSSAAPPLSTLLQRLD